MNELRTITVMFADIVGSTALGERLTPEEVKSIIGECVSRISGVIEEFGGTIQAYAGDGVCAYFGVPLAHEDDAERATRAALGVLDFIGDYRSDIRSAWGVQGFNVRIGINTGLTAVGLVGSAAPQTVALGDTTNVAARLQSVAEPGSVTIGDSTAKIIAPRFDLQRLGEVSLKGRQQPVMAWRVISPRDARDAPLVSPLVDRESELRSLRAVLDDVASGRGQILSVLGEAGIGKTRLLEELQSLGSGDVEWLKGRCTPYAPELLARPFVEILRAWLGVEEGDRALSVRTRLRAKLSALQLPEESEVIPYLARLLSLTLDPDTESRIGALTPETRWRGMVNAFHRWLEAMSGARPVVLWIDDFHRSSSWTRDLTEELLPVTDRAPVLLAVSFRPDPDSQAWRFRTRALSEFPHRTIEVQLGPLSEADSRKLARSMIGVETLDDTTKEALARRAEGNPLFLEELLRSVVESGGSPTERGWTLTFPRRRGLPASLETLFVARIDALPEDVRKVLQIAAVLGRDFPARLLQQLLPGDDIPKHLSALFRLDLIREVRRAPELVCTFKHGLVQEAALSMVTPQSQQKLHGRVGRGIEELYRGSIEDHLEMLAYHFYRSDSPEQALPYLERAGEQAAALSDYAQASAHWNRAIKVARRTENTQAEARITSRLQQLKVQ